jgi:hypothetical protein
MSDKIKSDPEALRDRLNQPAVTRFEVLQQVRASVPLSPKAEQEFQRLLLKEKSKSQKQPCQAAHQD